MKKRKRPVTLIEIMVVILLIGLIGGALAFNMKGSLDEGKKFKTEQNMARLYDVLMMEYAKGDETLEYIKDNAEAIVKKSSFAKDANILKNAKKHAFTFEIDGDELIIIDPDAPTQK